MDERTSKSAVRANHPESTEKTPIYIPVIHTRADMGALSEAIQRWKVKKLGRKGWECYSAASRAGETRVPCFPFSKSRRKLPFTHYRFGG